MAEKRWAFMSRKIIGSPDNPMLVRWRLIQTPWFGLYLHLIWREDLDRMPHDHPWAFASVVLRGGYEEEFYPDARTIQRGAYTRWFGNGRRRVHRFPSMAAHRIVRVLPHTTTLVLVGRKHRTWGFYDGAGRFIDWRDYHGITNGWNEQQQRERALHAAREKSA